MVVLIQEDIMKTPPFAKCMGTTFGRAAVLALGLASAEGPPAKAKPLFDGKTFAGWDGDTKKTWRIEDGSLVGGSLSEKTDWYRGGRNTGNHRPDHPMARWCEDPCGSHPRLTAS